MTAPETKSKKPDRIPDNITAFGSVGDNNHNDRSEHAYTERMVHGRTGEEIPRTV